MLPALRISSAVLGTSFQQNATLLRSIRGWRSQASSDGSETPFLDIGLDENEAGLSEVDVNGGGTVCSNGGEEVLCLETMDYLLQFLTVTSEEDSSSSRTITHADNVALNQGGDRKGSRQMVGYNGEHRWIGIQQSTCGNQVGGREGKA